jgi:hypothetical protein
MTDAELIARLRSALTFKDLRLCPTAADRIEALTGKLAKAVEALEYYAVEASLWDRATSRQARATLADLKQEGSKT